MQLSFQLDNKVLKIQLPATIDTTNAQTVEEAIQQIIKDNGDFSSLILDASKLTYISSVGLRIVLRLSQTYEDFQVIDVQSAVYEIFEMTGFTDIINIKKVLRQVSIEGCTVIGEGFYGRVYRISPDTIVKVYFRGGDIKDVERERKLAKTAFILGIPTAISYDIVKVNEQGKECYGSVFELLDCESLRNLIRDNPKNFDEYVKMHADLVKKINSTMVMSKDLPYAKEATKEWLKGVKEALDEETFKKLTDLIATIPDCDNMVHGDCHVKNILVQNGEPILIDMDTLSKGHQIFDVMAFYLSYIAYELTEPGNTKSFLGLEESVCTNLYNGIFKELYGDRNEKEQKEIQAKVETLGYLLLLWRTFVYDADNKDRKKLCVDRIKKHVAELDTLEY